MNQFYTQTSSRIAKYLHQELKLIPRTHYLVERATDGPRLLTLHLRINPHYAAPIGAMAEALSMAAHLDRATIRIQRGGRGTLSLEIPKPRSMWFNIGVNSFPLKTGMAVDLGINTRNDPADVCLSDPMTPHGLISGVTGSGKTNTARVLVYNLIRQHLGGLQLRFVLIDAGKRGRGWRGFERVPHLLHPPIADEEQARKALMWLCQERQRRIETGQSKPDLMCLIDEAQDILEQDGFVPPVKDLVTKGRESGIHCVLLTQKPTVEQLGDTVIKENLGLRLIGKVSSGIAAAAATGQRGSGAHLLTEAGDMLRVGPQGIERFTAFLLQTKDLERLPRAESVDRLELEPYEDVDRVVEPVSRQPDPVLPAQVAYALTDPNMSQRRLVGHFSIGFPKAKRILASAKNLTAELQKLDHYVCGGAWLRKHCQIP